ncbi:MAG: hypothetical protein LBU84_14690 [Prevotella sp.]|jgi:hypothetical protein|nr:hypothetical protein [Prevotella sp.]
MAFDIHLEERDIAGFTMQAKEMLTEKIKQYSNNLINESILLNNGNLSDTTSSDVNKQNVEDAANSLEKNIPRKEKIEKKSWYFHIPGIVGPGAGIILGTLLDATPPNLGAITSVTFIFAVCLVVNVIFGAKNG